MVKLFVGGFPLNMAEMELVQLISPYGTVSTIKIVRDKKTGKCKGYAFLEMTDQEGAEQAIKALDGTEIGDRVLSLNITPDKPVAAPKTFSPKNNFSKPEGRYSKVEKYPSSSSAPSKGKRPRKQF